MTKSTVRFVLIADAEAADFRLVPITDIQAVVRHDGLFATL